MVGGQANMGDNMVGEQQGEQFRQLRWGNYDKRYDINKQWVDNMMSGRTTKR